MILSRQNVPTLRQIPVSVRREGVLRGGYIIKKETGPVIDGIIIATGSEVALGLAAAEQLGPNVRVVSMPCTEIFEKQDEDYKASILPKSCAKRIAVEAGSTGGWYKYVGLKGEVIGVDTFGASAAGEELMVRYGMTTVESSQLLKN